MKFLKNAIRRFIGLGPIYEEPDRAISTRDEPDLIDNATTRVSLIPASNGKILQISTYKRNPNGPDWTNKYVLVMAGDNVSAIIATHLVAAAMTS